MDHKELTRRFNEIRDVYAHHDFSQYTPYLMDWTKIFSPIEYDVWSEIREYGLPLYPQLPVGKYFADFGDPCKKIAIECDGKQWHDADKDKIRDEYFNSIGWVVYRVPGSACRKVMPDLHDYELKYKSRAAFEYASALCETSDGLVRSIAVCHYDKSIWGNDKRITDLARMVLRTRSNFSEMSEHGAH